MRTRREIAAALLLGGALVGCNSAGAKVHNLGELHDDEGRHQRIGVLLGDFGYAIRSGFSGLVGDGQLRITEKEPRAIKNPLAECTEACVELAKIESKKPGTTTTRIAAFTRYSVNCRWKISREVCVRALGHVGDQLDLAQRPARLPDGPTAGPEEVGEAIRGLIASYPRPGGAPSEVSLEDACRALAELPLDRTGARLSLSTVGILLSGGRGKDFVPPLLELEDDLQRRAVTLALAEALQDSSEWVRAAAIDADIQAFGHDRLRLHLPKVADPRTSMDEVLAVLQQVRRRGFPESLLADREALDTAYEQLYLVGTQHPESRVRAAGMSALSRAADAGFDSLREEDWQAWILARRERE